ncbi:MAG: TetR/AcrR family transcriptional regulator [Alphaproteobacteria bacterium]|nr:TetR/AcrR family transcriptional regulator [Bacteroidales bacterium]MBQ2885490.1 TetR/AcrR family transcriptional regulator [Alphaproteobacteria bacterium]
MQLNYNNLQAMSTAETREQIIKVARRLFAQKGIDNITMSDIAGEANKSRRTVYTYFKSKEELLEASIEMEVKKISAATTKVAMSNLPPHKKIIKLVFVRLHATRNVVRRNSRLSSEYFNNVWIIEHIRRSFDSKEIALFRSIIAEGKQAGIFNVESPDLAARFLHLCLKGVEVPYINGIVSKHTDDKLMNSFTEKVILNALGTNPSNIEQQA